MSGQATGWVFRNGPTDRAMRLVLLTIADAANRDGEHAHPSIAGMCEGALYSEPHVHRIVKSLIEAGWIEITGNPNGGRGMATEYRLPGVKGSHSDTPPQPVDNSVPSSERVSKGSHPSPQRVSKGSRPDETPTYYGRTTYNAATSNSTGFDDMQRAANRIRAINILLPSHPHTDCDGTGFVVDDGGVAHPCTGCERTGLDPKILAEVPA